MAGDMTGTTTEVIVLNADRSEFLLLVIIFFLSFFFLSFVFSPLLSNK